MRKLTHHRKAVKYLISGFLAFVVDYLLLLAGYYLLLLPLWVATSSGYLGGLCVSFFINREWVYGESGKQHKMTKQLIEYALLLLFNYIVTVATIHLLNSRNISPDISKIFVTAALACWNYVIFSKVIFVHKKNS